MSNWNNHDGRPFWILWSGYRLSSTTNNWFWSINCLQQFPQKYFRYTGTTKWFPIFLRDRMIWKIIKITIIYPNNRCYKLFPVLTNVVVYRRMNNYQEETPPGSSHKEWMTKNLHHSNQKKLDSSVSQIILFRGLRWRRSNLFHTLVTQ